MKKRPVVVCGLHDGSTGFSAIKGSLTLSQRGTVIAFSGRREPYRFVFFRVRGLLSVFKFRSNDRNGFRMVSPPEWLESFANEVAANIISFDVLSPIGCHYQLVMEVWEVTVFVSETEVVGGSQDGKRISCPFSLDVKKISELFSQIDGMAWQNQTLDMHDEIGLHFAIEGQYLDQQVLLRVTATAPNRFEAGRRAVVNSRRFEELW